jgi:hypothetical protein
MDDKERQIEEMGEAREAQYALECVLVRLTEAELQRVIDYLPPRAHEHIRVTPRWDAHTMPICTCNTPVLGAPASIMGSELPRRPRYGAPALRFAPVPCRKGAERS